jgi:sulfur-oxidizing protein SoxZ
MQANPTPMPTPIPAPIPMRLTMKGDIKTARLVQAVLAIGHPMESGYRVLESGERVPKNVIERITVRLGDTLLFEMQTSIGISAHPYMAFPVMLSQALRDKASSGSMRIVAAWTDDQGQRGELSRDLALELR